MKRRQQRIHRILQLNAIFALWFRRLTVPLVLAAWRVPDLLGRFASRVRADFVTGRALLAAVVCAAIVVPTVMYQQERSKRMEMSRAYRYLNTSATTEIGALRHSLLSLLDEQEELKSMLLDAGYAVASDGQISVRLVATGYSSTVWETDDTPFITASNTRTRPGVIALSRDLLKRHNPDAPFAFGDVVHISGYGDFIVEDSMHWRWRRRVDIWFASRYNAWQFGKRDVTLSMPLDSDAASALGATGTGVTGAPRFASNSRAELPQ